MTAPLASPSVAPGGLDRRFYALAVDAALLGAVFVLAGLAWMRLAESRPGLAGGLAAGTAVLELVAYGIFQGIAGTSPGKAATRLRLVSAADRTPIGVPRSVLRSLIVFFAAVPTFGLGLATLAWTALADRSGQRRGWHDRVAGSVVLETRPMVEAPVVPPPEPPRELVNLSMMRLRGVETGPAPGDGPAGQSDPALPTPAPAAAPHPMVTDPIIRPPAGIRPTDPRPVVWTVRFDTGEVIEVEGLGLVGRRPEGRPGEGVRHLVPLPSSDMSVSKTHAQFHLAEGALVVMDRGSTNGTTLIRRGVSRTLATGRPATLLDGDRVRFGDREMTVSRRRVDA